MNKYTRMNWENTPSTATPLTADNLNHMDEGIEQATDGAIALEAEVNQLKGNAEIDETNLETVKSEITAARGESETLGERLDNLLPDEVGVITTDHMRDGSVKASKIANDAITTDKIIAKAITASKLSLELLTLINSVANKADTADVDTALAKKADKSTTLDGYGITDAYTKATVKTLLAGKLDAMSFDSEPTLNSPCYLTSGTVYNSLLTKADVNSVYSKTEADVKLGKKVDKADVDDVKAYIGYTDSDILGLQVDFENKTFTRLAGAVGLSANSDFDKFTMYGGRKRCNVSDDGTIVAYYGDENYAEDGSNGQVMVYQPAFYYKVVPLKLEKNSDSGIGYHIRKANYYVSSKPKTGFKLHPAFRDENGNAIDYILYSAYEGSMYDSSAKAYVNDNVDESITYEDGDLLCSVAGKKPISGLGKEIGTKQNFETMANNRGSGWHLETIKATSANLLMMMIEIGMMNSQTGVGQGVVSITGNASDNCSSLTGSTADLGNGTGSATETINEIGGTETAYTTAGKLAVSYRGVENPWGNIWKQVQGINIWGDGTMCGGQPYIANDFAFSESKHSENYEGVGFTLPNANGYINAMGYGKEEYDWLLMPSEIGGSSALPVGDYTYTAQNLKGHRVVRRGGSWSGGVNNGGFLWVSNGYINNRNRNLGGRLVYIPTAKFDDKPPKSYSASEVDALLATKYDSSNVEVGKGNLAPAQAIYDGFEGSFNYSKIGKTVTVALNITTLVAGKNYVQFAGLPFKAMTASKLSSIAVYTTANKLVNLRLDGSGLYVSSPGTTFADGEKINAIITYIIG